MKLKHVLVFSTLLFIAFLTSASTSSEGQLDLPTESGVLVEIAGPIAPIPDIRKDCKVRIDHELPDGGTVKGELVFEDVTWWQCSKMQVAAWWDRNF